MSLISDLMRKSIETVRKERLSRFAIISNKTPRLSQLTETAFNLLTNHVTEYRNFRSVKHDNWKQEMEHRFLLAIQVNLKRINLPHSSCVSQSLLATEKLLSKFYRISGQLQ